MGMDKEFDQAKKWVKDSLTFNHATEVSVFETTIRELGGLLSAFDLSGDDVFKEKVCCDVHSTLNSSDASSSLVPRSHMYL